MAVWQTTPGDTLLVPSGPKGLHLFVLILGPITLPSYGTQPQLAMVSVTSIKEGIPHDTACVLAPDDHPFIQRPSYVAYRHLRIDSLSHVSQMVGSSWQQHQQCSPVLLQRIIQGVCLSRLTPREFKAIFGCL